MASYPSLAQTLTDSLHLERPPVAVCFADAVPSGVKQFTGSVPAGCRFWQEAQSGVFATVPARSRSVRHRDLYAQSGSLARGAKGSGRCAQSIRRPGLRSRTGYSTDSGSEKSSAGGHLRPAESGSAASGRRAAIRERGSNADTFGGFAAVRRGPASGHGTSGLCRGAASFEQQPDRAQPGMLRGSCLSGYIDTRGCSVRDSREEARSVHRARSGASPCECSADGFPCAASKDRGSGRASERSGIAGGTNLNKSS